MLTKMMSQPFAGLADSDLEAFIWYTSVALPIVACCGIGNAKKEEICSPDFLKTTVTISDEGYTIWILEKSKEIWASCSVGKPKNDKRFHSDKNILAFQEITENVDTARESTHRPEWIKGYISRIKANQDNAAEASNSALNNFGVTPPAKEPASRFNFDILAADDGDCVNARAAV